MEWCPACRKEVGVVMDVSCKAEGSEKIVRFLCIHCRHELFTEKKGLGAASRTALHPELPPNQ